MLIKKYKIKNYIFITIFILSIGLLCFIKYSNTKSIVTHFLKNYTKKIAKKINPDNPNKDTKKESEQETYVQAFKVKTVEFKDELKDIVGTVKGSSLEIKSLQEEKLLKFKFKPGDELKKGDVIAELDHTRTKAKLDQISMEYDKKKMLLEYGGISKNELLQTKAALDIAKKDYEDTFITAPKNGYMGEIIAQEGELITRQMPIAIFVSSEDNFFIETSIIESNLPLIQANQKVTIKLDILPDEIIEGKLLSISPEATTSSRMIPIRVNLPPYLNKKLKPGFSAVCTILIFQKNTKIIPQTAILKEKNQIYTIDTANTTHLRCIEIGYRSKNYIEVLKGLDENSIIINNPDYAGIKEGIKTKYSDPEEYKPESKTNNEKK